MSPIKNPILQQYLFVHLVKNRENEKRIILLYLI